MPQAPQVLFVTSEVSPLVKTGGLADVSRALPARLKDLGADLRLLVPGYPQCLQAVSDYRECARLPAHAGFPQARLLESQLGTVPLYVLDCPPLYYRAGGPYSDGAGSDWPDNALRFAILARVAAMLAGAAPLSGWRPNILHCNDWQSGLAPAYLRLGGDRKTASVMAVHNLSFQGIFPLSAAAALGLPPTSLHSDGVEYYGNLSFLKAGLYYADRITTVSPSYAEEIQTEPMGMGMQGLLARRRGILTGILNGIDTDEWNPANDPHLAFPYDQGTLELKTRNKRALQETMGLTQDPAVPLLGMVARMANQKGPDVLLEIAPDILRLPAQLALLGNGDPALERAFLTLARTHPGSVGVHVGFEERTSHLIEAGADMFLMPSRFEPCGLNQMFSQRYGTPPIAHATGGLKDTVADTTPAALADGSAAGFVFKPLTAVNFLAAIKRAIAAYRDKKTWRAIQRNGMKKDFGWEKSARQYLDIYTALLRERS